jgi:2-oxoglutarate ferredoxin oxidoreductase subunit alpha
VVESQVHERMVRRISRKVQMHSADICEYERFMTDDANVVVIAYGITARAAREAVLAARERGIRAGLLRLITLWPFPAGTVKELANVVRRFVVAELNLGQIAREIERHTRCPVNWVNHAGGEMLSPELILRGILQVKP